MNRLFLLFGVTLQASVSLTAVHAIQLPEIAPIPTARPAVTGSEIKAEDIGVKKRPISADLLQLKASLEALSRNDIMPARELRDKVKAGSLSHQLLLWSIATSNSNSVTSDEILEAMQELVTWLGQTILENAFERALARENGDTAVVLKTYKARQPVTLAGKLQLLKAYLAHNMHHEARPLIAEIWRNEVLDPKLEDWIIQSFGFLLTVEDHHFRMEKMFNAERLESARRVTHLARTVRLASAWTAAIQKSPKTLELLDQVPFNQRTGGWFFARSQYLRRQGQFVEAANTFLSVSHDVDESISPDIWWVERRVLARELLDIGQDQLAFKIVAAQTHGSPATQVDAAFHAGWIALRFLDDSITAALHFERIITISTGAISLARGHFWLGRAFEASNLSDMAKQQYEKAANFQTAFYGQMAAERIGLSDQPITLPLPNLVDRMRFERTFPIRALHLLEELGLRTRATSLYRALAQSLLRPEEIALLSEMAGKQNNHYLALQIVKIAATRGIEIGALTHPKGAIPEDILQSETLEALAYAIARQESEFNIGAVSSVGALGLLQLMPSTAKDMAKKTGLPFSALRLSSDAAYNAKLGTAYLEDQLGRFDNSYILTFAGYNAGPRRVQEWISRFGDPRGKPIDDVLDWLERIPFTETRNYVQRVSENFHVYQRSLKQTPHKTLISNDN